MAMGHKAWDAFRTAFDARKPLTIRGNSLSAHVGAAQSTGRLSGAELDAYREARNNDKIDYTVMSYGTPIAWVLIGGDVIIPATSYSRTTTAQQNFCRAWLR